MKSVRIKQVFVALAALASGAAEAATLTVADISSTEVTEVTQAAAASVTTLNALAKNRLDLSRARRADLTSQLSALQLYLNGIDPYLKQVLLDTRSDKAAARTAAKVALAAKDKALQANNEAIAALKEEAGQRYQTAMDAATAETLNALISIASALDADIAALNSMIQKLTDEIEKLTEEIAKIRDRIKQLEEAKEKANRTKEGKDAAIKAIVDANADAADANRTALCFTRISQDTTQAATLAAAIRNNLSNPSGFASSLKTICNFPELIAQEVREATGLVTVFRTSRLTHCVSTKLQCSAKAYSVSP